MPHLTDTHSPEKDEAEDMSSAVQGQMNAGLKYKTFTSKHYAIRKGVRRMSALLDWSDNIPDIEKINERRRISIVNHAFDTVPFYRELYQGAGFSKGDLSSISNFSSLPLLTRDMVKDNFEALVSRKFDVSHIGIASTGGSTGKPLKVGTDPRNSLEVISWRGLARWGVSAAENSGYLYRAVPGPLGRAVRSVFNYPTRRHYLSAMKMSADNMADFAESLQKSRATYLVGYVGALDVFADFVLERNISLPALKVVWSTAAPLSVFTRSKLESAFRSPAYSQYGSCEFYWIAAEAPDRNGLLVDWDIRHVEIVGEDGRDKAIGEYGDIYVTDLLNEAFPLIRYEIGDRSRFIDDGRSGEFAKRLDFVQGRVSDTIKLKNGQSVPGEFWTTIFDDYPLEVESFKVIQKKDYSILITYRAAEGCTESLSERIVDRIKGEFGDCDIQCHPGDGHENVAGKIKFVTSEVIDQRS